VTIKVWGDVRLAVERGGTRWWCCDFWTGDVVVQLATPVVASSSPLGLSNRCQEKVSTQDAPVQAVQEPGVRQVVQLRTDAVIFESWRLARSARPKILGPERLLSLRIRASYRSLSSCV
jgi:hypothetical protein